MNRTIFIDTNALPHEAMEGGGTMTEILSERLAGAKNVTGTLRRLGSGQSFEARPLDRHQLLYVMEGSASLTLAGSAHEIRKGMGVYLGPSEGAAIATGSGGAATLFHLVVRRTSG